MNQVQVGSLIQNFLWTKHKKCALIHVDLVNKCNNKEADEYLPLLYASIQHPLLHPQTPLKAKASNPLNLHWHGKLHSSQDICMQYCNKNIIYNFHIKLIKEDKYGLSYIRKISLCIVFHKINFPNFYILSTFLWSFGKTKYIYGQQSKASLKKRKKNTMEEG